jgi:hypothetical protein
MDTVDLKTIGKVLPPVLVMIIASWVAKENAAWNQDFVST